MPTIFAEIVWTTLVTFGIHIITPTESLVSMGVANDEGVTNSMIGRIRISLNDVGNPHMIARVHVGYVFHLLPFRSSWDLESVNINGSNSAADVLETSITHTPPDQQMSLVAESCFVEPSRPVR